MPTYDGDPNNCPTSLTLPVDGNKPKAAEWNVAFEGLADRTAHLMGTGGPVVFAADGSAPNIGWQNSRVRVPTLTGNRTASLIHGGVPPFTGARVRFTRTQVDPDYTLTIERQTDFAVLCVMPIITSAPNDGEQSWVEVEWTGAKWQMAAWSPNITNILNEA